jgi:hypothetical protein
MLERIRAAISGELLALGVSDLAELRETILIRDGLFCGRKFRCCGHSVVWFMEENQIKFFGPAGNLLRTASPEQCLASLDQASHNAASHNAASQETFQHVRPSDDQSERRAA